MLNIMLKVFQFQTAVPVSFFHVKILKYLLLSWFN